LPLHTRIFIGLAVGIVAGSVSRLFFGDSLQLQQFTTYAAEPFGRLFMRLIFMVVVPLMVPLLQSVGVPGEGIGVILGVDRLLDMSRTVLNVVGDVTAAVVVANSEGRMPPQQSS